MRCAVVPFLVLIMTLSPSLSQAQCFQGEQQKRLDRKLHAPVSKGQQEIVKRLATLQRDRDWLGTVTLCDEILVQRKYAGVMIESGQGSWRSLRSYVRTLIQKLPEDGIQFYRRRRGSKAERLWKEKSRESLQTLLNDYPLPEYQRRIRQRLFNEWSEEGAFHDAYRIVEGWPQLRKRLPEPGTLGSLRELQGLSQPVKVKAKAPPGKKRCHEEGHLACFPGAKVTLLIQCQVRDDPAFQGAEFSGLELPKRRLYHLQGLRSKDKSLLWTRPLCVLGGKGKGLGGVFQATQGWIYGVLEHELMFCVNRATGELLWLRDLRPKGPLAIQIGGPEMNQPNTSLWVDMKSVLRLDVTKKRAERMNPVSGASLAQYTGSDDDLFFSVLNGRVLRIDRERELWLDSKKLDESRGPPLKKIKIMTIDARGSALMITQPQSILIWFPSSGEQYQLPSHKTEIIKSVKRTMSSLRIRYRGKDYWERYLLPKKQQLKLSIPKGS